MINARKKVAITKTQIEFDESKAATKYTETLQPGPREYKCSANTKRRKVLYQRLLLQKTPTIHTFRP